MTIAATEKRSAFLSLLTDSLKQGIWRDLTCFLRNIKPTKAEKADFEGGLKRLNEFILSRLKKSEEKSQEVKFNSVLTKKLMVPVPYEQERIHSFDCADGWSIYPTKDRKELRLRFAYPTKEVVVENENNNSGIDHHGRAYSIPPNSSVFCKVGLIYTFLFKTGEKNVLNPFHLPCKEGRRPIRSEAAEVQSEKVRKSHFFVEGRPVKCSYTDLAYASEITEPFLDGFYYYSHLTVLSGDATIAPIKCERIIIDFNNDHYLAAKLSEIQSEFNQMDYSDLEKLQRLCLISHSLFSDPSDKQFDFFHETDYSYYLGELVRFGYGLHHHHALFMKAMAERLGIKNVFMVSSYDDQGEHSWNVALIDKDYFVIDAYQTLFCNPLQLNTKAADYYGSRVLLKASGNS